MEGHNVQDALLAAGIPVKTVARFISWHNQHPEIWTEFERLALEAIQCGVKRWGAKGIAEVVRYTLAIKRRGHFLLNNNWPAYYARVFLLKHPEHAGFFEFRHIEGVQEGSA